MPRFRVKVLENEDRSTFVSPTDTFTTYFREQAGQAQRRRLSVVYIVLDEENNDSIVGYYTLSNSAVGTDLLKTVSSLKLGTYELSPTTLLGMLSRCNPSPDRSFGKALLFQALATCAHASRFSSSVAVVLNPFGEGRAEWYRRLQFKELFPESPGAMLYYEMRKIQDLHVPMWPGTTLC